MNTKELRKHNKNFMKMYVYVNKIDDQIFHVNFATNDQTCTLEMFFIVVTVFEWKCGDDQSFHFVKNFIVNYVTELVYVTSELPTEAW